ncbi:MAG: type II toxin-antitoxin system VapC family toxin [Desulfatiglandaceae bacterium]|jgi:predicted nucleic acid-binding protein
MKIVIVDTSALIRLYVPDGPIPDGLEEYLAAAWRGEIALMIPELALAEFVQVLWKKEQAGYLESSEVGEIVAALLELPIEVVGHHGILMDALSLARPYGLTVYDSLFLSLARKKKAELVTADQRLKNAFGDSRGTVPF